MIEPQQLIRRHDRIRAVWQRTPSANTAERCRLRMASIAREAREDFARTITATLPLPGSTVRTEDLENMEGSHGRSGPLAVATGSVASP